MQHIQMEELKLHLRSYEGKQVYVHVEVTPGAFVRNVKVHIAQTYANGNGPYRVALRLEDDGWIRVEGLTHLTIDAEGRLIVAGHDEKGRLTAALELSIEPFPA